MKMMTFDELERLARRLGRPVRGIPMPDDLYAASVEYHTDDPTETWLIDLTGRLERRIDRGGRIQRTRFHALPRDVSSLFVDYVLDALAV